MQSPASSTDEGASRFSAYLAPVLFLTGMFFINFLSRIIFAPLLPTIEQDLGIGHGDAGSLFLLVSLGYFTTLLASGFISARILHRRTIILSAVCLSAALFFIASTHGLWGIRLGLFVVGMAAGLYLPSGIASITALVSPRHWGKALAIHELAPNGSFVLAPLLAELLLQWLSWRNVVIALGAATLLSAAAFSRFGRGGDFPGKAPSFAAFKDLLVLSDFWVMILLFTLGLSATMGVYTMLPLYLVAEHGMDRSVANSLIGLSRILSIGMAFVAGWACDRLGAKRTLRTVFILTGLTTLLLGLAPGRWLVLVIFVQPLVAVCFFPPAFATLSAIGPPSTRNIAVSLTIPAAFIMGGGCIPLLIGMLGDSGRFPAGMMITGALVLTGALLAGLLKIQGEGKDA